MLAIDAGFFVLELGVGMVVGSLALMADAFHMVRRIQPLAGYQTDAQSVERHYLPCCWVVGCASCTKADNRQILVWRK